MSGRDRGSAPDCWLIREWRQGWRFWSVRLQALGVASGTLLALAPDVLADIWQALPVDLRAAMPGGLARWLPVLLGLLAIAARFLRQRQAGHDD